jgi:HK97 family phage major capsid protein
VQEHKTMTLAEQIAAFEAKRAAKAARMDELMSKAADEGVTLDDAESEEYDTLTAETAKIDAHLVRLAALEKANKAKAVAVPANANGTAGTEAVPVQRASSMRIEVNDLKLPKGTAFTRYAVALMRGKGNLMQAAEIAKQWDNETPEVGRVLRAAVAAGTTTDPAWAAPLVDYQTMTGEFLELLRPATILGRIPGLRRVPFNISLPRQTAGSSVGWVGEAKPKPVSSLAFDTVTLRWAKAAGIVVMTEELVRFSSPSAEGVVRQDLVATMAHFLDVQFLDPNVAAVANVSPASITNGVTPIPASGTTADHLRADAMAAINAMLAAGLGLSSAVWIMDEVTAATIGGMMNAFGQPEFPGIGAFGGTFFGLPVITSEATPGDDGSPPDRMIVLVKANSIMLADDGQTTLDVSREASLQMNSTPDDPASATTVFVSLWQNNMVGVRAERWINWLRARTGAVQWISGVAYSLAA